MISRLKRLAKRNTRRRYRRSLSNVMILSYSQGHVVAVSQKGVNWKRYGGAWVGTTSGTPVPAPAIMSEQLAQ